MLGLSQPAREARERTRDAQRSGKNPRAVRLESYQTALGKERDVN